MWWQKWMQPYLDGKGGGNFCKWSGKIGKLMAKVLLPVPLPLSVVCHPCCPANCHCHCHCHCFCPQIFNKSLDSMFILTWFLKIVFFSGWGLRRAWGGPSHSHRFDAEAQFWQQCNGHRHPLPKFWIRRRRAWCGWDWEGCQAEAGPEASSGTESQGEEQG